VIWLGDFNYRIGLSNPSVKELILQRDYQKLYDNDQVSQLSQDFLWGGLVNNSS